MNDRKTSAAITPPASGGRVLWFETAWGRSCLIYSLAPFALFRIFLPGFTGDIHPDPDDLSRPHHPSAIRTGQIITDFFNGYKPPPIPKTWLSLARLTSKESAVLNIVRRIPYGATRSYGRVADLAGFPGGARFAGNALNKNPFPVIIPCHRVIRSDGTIGGFATGCEMKQKMIALEAATLATLKNK